MNSTPQALPRKNALLLLTLAILPVLGVFYVYFFQSIALLKFAVFGFTAMALGFVFFFSPKFSLLVAVFYVYSGLSFYFHLHVAYPIVMIAFFAVLLRHFIGNPIEMRDGMFNWSVAVFTLIALTSMLYARSPGQSLFGFSKFIKVFILVFLALQLLKKPEDLERYGLVIFIGGLMSVLFGLANLQLGIAKDLSVVGFAKVTRFEGTHENPNRLAIYLASALPLGFYAVKRAKRLVIRVSASVASFILVLAIFATFSRAAVFPMVFALVATMIREVKSRKVYFGIFLLIVVVILITPTYYWARVLSLGAVIQDLPNDWSIYMRMQAAKSAIALFLQYPLTGVGFENFIVRSGSYLYTALVAHNAYLEILVGIGIFGFIAWMCILLSCVRACLRGMRYRWDDGTVWMKDLSFYMLLSFVSALMNILFLSAGFGYFVWIPLAGGLVAGNLVRRQIDAQQT